jgi:hypothetical protein
VAALVAALAHGESRAASPAPCSERCLTLHGSKEADHELRFTVAYTTTAKTDGCVVHNRLAGVTVAATRYEFMPPVRKGERYRIDIPLDQHTGGKCGWKVAGVFLDVPSVASRQEPPKPGSTLFSFSETPGAPARVNLECRKTAYKRPSGAEQAFYLCRAEGSAGIPALGKGSHSVELNFGERQGVN